MRRGQELSACGIEFLDVGVSGGIWGLSGGYSLMVGGNEEVYRRLEPIFQSPGALEHHRVQPDGALRGRPFCQNGAQRG